MDCPKITPLALTSPDPSLMLEPKTGATKQEEKSAWNEREQLKPTELFGLGEIVMKCWNFIKKLFSSEGSEEKPDLQHSMDMTVSFKPSFNKGFLIQQSNEHKGVFTALDESGKGLIVKEITIPNNKIFELESVCENIVRLVRQLSQHITHKNLVQYIYIDYSEGKITQVTEKLSLRFEDFSVSDENSIKVIFRQLLEVMHYLHQNEIFNVNLKESNLLMDDRGNLKLRDYLATNFFEFVEGVNDEFIKMTSLNERNYGVKKDIDALVKLL